MYRVLLVDDEPNIVDGLAMLLYGYEKYELDIIKASSAEEALEVIEEANIHLLITDIIMGNMTGLELAERVSRIWDECRIIILTGYNDFSYIYKATKLKNVQYILKTEDDSVLLNTITRALDELSEQIDVSLLIKDVEEAKRELHNVMIALRKGLYDEITSSSMLDERQLDVLFNKSKLNICTSHPILAVCGKFSCPYMEAMAKFDELMKSFLGRFVGFNYLPVDSYTLVWLFQPLQRKDEAADAKGPDDRERLKTIVKNGLENIQTRCRSVLGIDLSFAVGTGFIPVVKLNDEFRLLNSILKAFNTPDSYMMIIDAGAYAQKELDDLSKENLLISKINTYIINNINNALSLTKIARAVYLNPSYLSRYYKEVTGKNILDYINEVKVEIAKDLLINTQLKIKQVALKVGFESPSYFTYLFKKQMKMSPKEFRDLITNPVE